MIDQLKLSMHERMQVSYVYAQAHIKTHVDTQAATSHFSASAPNQSARVCVCVCVCAVGKCILVCQSQQERGNMCEEPKPILNPSLIPTETQPQQKVKQEKLFCGLIKIVKLAKQSGPDIKPLCINMQKAQLKRSSLTKKEKKKIQFLLTTSFPRIDLRTKVASLNVHGVVLRSISGCHYCHCFNTSVNMMDLQVSV